MNATEQPQRLTVSDVLLDGNSGTDSRTKGLARSMSTHDAVRSGIKGLRHLSGSAMRAVTSQITEAVLKSLDLLDLKDLLLGGWRRYKDLTDAAVRTLARTGSEELVTLAPHKIVSKHHPSVDIVVHEATVCTCTFDLTVVFDLNGVLAVVRGGKLAALRGGTSIISTTLAMGEVPLLPPKEQRLDLAKFVTLSPGVPLLDEKARTGEGDTARPAPPHGR